jgi:hypothetical protein
MRFITRFLVGGVGLEPTQTLIGVCHPNRHTGMSPYVV